MCYLLTSMSYGCRSQDGYATAENVAGKQTMVGDGMATVSEEDRTKSVGRLVDNTSAVLAAAVQWALRYVARSVSQLGSARLSSAQLGVSSRAGPGRAGEVVTRTRPYQDNAIRRRRRQQQQQPAASSSRPGRPADGSNRC